MMLIPSVHPIDRYSLLLFCLKIPLSYGFIGISHSKVNSTLDRCYATSLSIPAPSILPLVQLLSVLFHFNIQQFKTCRRVRSTRGMHS
eukprot:scaffold637_cov109-Cylindrotheca_fusiformis.AAC.3